MSKHQMNDYFLQRGFAAELRAAEPSAENVGNIIEGLGAVYEQEAVIYDPQKKRTFIEIIKRGAFDECDFTDVRLLVNHNKDGIPLARSRNNNNGNDVNTMRITAEAEGVRIRANIDTDNNEQARAAYSAVRRRDLTGMSLLMFVKPLPDCERWSRRNGIEYREIFKVAKVTEFSLVNSPAYEGTNIEARSLESDRKALDNAIAALDSADKNTVEIQRLKNQILFNLMR